MTAYDDYIASLKSKTGVGTPVKNGSNFFSGFLTSAMSSIPELLGADPLKQATEFRQEHPVGGFVSQALPSLVPYAGWGYATTKIPAAVRALDAVESLTSSRMLGGALKESARFAPLEGVRVATSQVMGDGKNSKDITSQALFNTATAGAFGAAKGLIEAVGHSIPLPPELSKEVELRAPTPLKLRKLKELQGAGAGDAKANEFHINQFTDEVYRENAIPGDRYVQSLDTGSDGENISRLFKSSEKGTDGQGSITGRRLHAADWKDRVGLTQFVNNSGLKGKEEFVLFPRYVEVNSKAGAKFASKSIVNGLRKVSSDTWMAREADDGLFVMAVRKAVGKPEVEKAGTNFGQGDKWLLFKTDKPELFAPMGSSWAAKVVQQNAWAPEVGFADTELGNSLKASTQLTTVRNFNDIKRVGPTQWLAEMRKKLKVDTSPVGTSARLMYDFAKEHVAPSKFQFNQSPRANYIFTQAKNLTSYADSLAHGIMYGEQAPEDGKIVRMVFMGARGTNYFKGKMALEPLVDDLYKDPADVAAFWRASNQAMSVDEVDNAIIKGDISPKAGAIYKQIVERNAETIDQVQKTQEAYGLQVTPAREGHLGLAHTWEGDARVPIVDADAPERLITLEGGKDSAAAKAKATKIIEEAKKEGKNWKMGDPFTAAYDAEMEDIITGNPRYRINMTSPDFRIAQGIRESLFRGRTYSGERSGLGGYIGEKAPWTKDEFKKLLFTGVQKQQRYMAEQNILYGLQKDMFKLGDEDPQLLRQVKQRIDDLMGRQGKSSKLINETFDKFAAPYLGANSATKIVGALNSFNYHGQLGMGNLMFPLLNATTFLQTTLPHAAFVMEAPREAIAKYYSWLPMFGSDAKPVGGMGHISMPKLMTQSFKELFKPDQALLDGLSRGAREGVWAPRNVEEFVGENSKTIADLSAAHKGGLFNWVKAVSSFLPEASERFSRSHSFAMGHILGRDFLNLQGDQLYRFAKDFTENTMFGYSTADRARIITGPLGSLFGLYKNWQMHYLGWMSEYTGQAMNGNIKPLLYMMAGSGITGGAAAMPIYGAAQGINSLFSDDSLMKNIYETFGPAGTSAEHISDGIYYGLPGFLGLSLQSSASAPGANPVRDAAQLFSFAQYDRAKALGVAAGKAIDAYKTTGEHPVNSPAVRDAIIKALAPRSLVRGMQSVEDGFIRSMNTGNPIASATPMQRFLYGLGFTPTAVDRQLKVSDELFRDQAKLKAAVSSYGQAWFEAQLAGDGDAMHNLLLKAMGDGVPLDSIMKSAVSRKAKRNEDQLDRLGTARKLQDLSAIYRR
jgi:hypothetical protein